MTRARWRTADPQLDSSSATTITRKERKIRHRPLVLAIALSMAAFMLLIVTAHMQEIGGQIAELPAQMNRGPATEVSAALTHVAFAIHQVDRVEIHCDPANVRSAAIPRKLGYSLEATLPGQGKGIDGLPRASMIWILLRENYAGTPAATLPLRGYDAAGREIHMTSALSEAG